MDPGSRTSTVRRTRSCSRTRCWSRCATTSLSVPTEASASSTLASNSAMECATSDHPDYLISSRFSVQRVSVSVVAGMGGRSGPCARLGTIPAVAPSTGPPVTGGLHEAVDLKAATSRWVNATPRWPKPSARSGLRIQIATSSERPIRCWHDPPTMNDRLPDLVNETEQVSKRSRL